MIPFNTSFRHLLQKYIPQISDSEIKKHEDFIGLRFHLFHEIGYIPTENIFEREKGLIKDEMKYKEFIDGQKKEISDNIRNITNEANDIFENYRLSKKKDKHIYNNIHKLWIARQELLMEQGSFLQIPPTTESFCRFVKKAINYQLVRFSVLPK